MGVRKVLIGCCVGLLSLNMLYATTLDLTKKTPHLVFHFSENDNSTVTAQSQELESFYSAISEEFSFSSKDPLNINIYPDTQSFHEALGLINASPWIVARATDDTVYIVSPSCSGLCHSRESMNKIMKLNIIKAMLFNKFGLDNIPYWLSYGVGAMKTQFGNPSHSFKYIPSLTELEKSNNSDFSKIDGFGVAYAFVKFIEERFGRETLIDLLSNYELRKEELYQSWIDSLS